MREVLRFLGGGVVDLVAQLGDIFFHPDAAGALVVVPLVVDTCV